MRVDFWIKPLSGYCFLRAILPLAIVLSVGGCKLDGNEVKGTLGSNPAQEETTPPPSSDPPPGPTTSIRMLFVGDDLVTDNFKIYQADDTTGQLTLLQSHTMVGTARETVVHPDLKMAYVLIGNKLYFYQLDSGGGLVEHGSSPFTLSQGGSYERFFIHPNNKFLYFASTNNLIDVLEINQTTGVVTAVSGSPFDTGDASIQVFGLGIHPNGDYLYVSAFWPQRLAVFSLNSTDGSLSLLPTYPKAGGQGTYYMNVTPDGKQAIAHESLFSSGWTVYDIGGDGDITYKDFVAGGSGAALQNSMTDDGEYLFSMDFSANKVFILKRNPSTGALTLVGDTVVGSEAYGVQVVGDGSFVYGAARTAKTIEVYSFSRTTDTLTPIQTITAGDGLGKPTGFNLIDLSF